MFRFCFVELTMRNPIAIDRPSLVFPLMFGCTTNDPSIHHFSIPLPLALIISVRFLVPLIYFVRWTNFFAILVVRLSHSCGEELNFGACIRPGPLGSK